MLGKSRERLKCQGFFSQKISLPNAEPGRAGEGRVGERGERLKTRRGYYIIWETGNSAVLTKITYNENSIQNTFNLVPSYKHTDINCDLQNCGFHEDSLATIILYGTSVLQNPLLKSPNTTVFLVLIGEREKQNNALTLPKYILLCTVMLCCPLVEQNHYFLDYAPNCTQGPIQIGQVKGGS